MAKSLGVLITAKARCFVSGDHKRLVGEGDKDAAILFAAKGHAKRQNQVEHFANAAEFFDGMEAPPAPEPEPVRKNRKEKDA